MNRIKRYINKPFPVIRRPWMIIMVPSFTIALLLYLFRPFGLDRGIHIEIKVLAFTCVTAIPIFLGVKVFPLIFKKFYAPENWTLGKHGLICLLIVGTIATGNFLLYNSISSYPLTIFYGGFFFWVFVTFFIGLIPVTIITFLLKNEDLKLTLIEIRNKKGDLKEVRGIKENESSDIGEIILSGSTKEKVKLQPENIVFIEASGNYVRINYTTDSKLRCAELRATISHIESLLQSCSDIIRCHRAFLVNISHVLDMEGNSQKLWLHMQFSKEKIPVSRSYIKEIQSKLIKVSS